MGEREGHENMGNNTITISFRFRIHFSVCPLSYLMREQLNHITMCLAEPKTYANVYLCSRFAKARTGSSSERERERSGEKSISMTIY